MSALDNVHGMRTLRGMSEPTSKPTPEYLANKEAIDAQEEARESYKEAMAGPEPGTYAYTARALVELGIMSGDEADQWKDEMKDRED